MICRIIIVEDEPAILQGITSLISKITLPINIVGVYTNAEAAIIEISETRPHIVITDIQMPGMSGLEMISHIKSENDHVEFLILSGYADFEYVREALKLSVHNYLLKPPRVSELTHSLSYLCEKITQKTHEQVSDHLKKLLSMQRTGAFPGEDLVTLPGYLLLYHQGNSLSALPFDTGHTEAEQDSSELSAFLQRNSIPLEALWINDMPLFTQKLFICFDPEHIDTSVLAGLLLDYAGICRQTATVVISQPITDISQLPEQASLCLQKLQTGIKPDHSQILDINSASGQPQIEDVVNLLYRRLHDDLSCDVDLEEFSRSQGYNQNYLISQFSAIKGISPKKLMIRLRMEQAARLLGTTGLSTKEIAQSVGYTDLAYFSRAFKEYTGQSPKSYRNKESC